MFTHVCQLFLQLNELIIGSVDGVLAIFKGNTDAKPWRKCSDLGMVNNEVPILFFPGFLHLVAQNAVGKQQSVLKSQRYINAAATEIPL